MKEHIIQVNDAKCVGCGICQSDCPAGNIMVVKRQAVLKSQDCVKCGHCVAVCPKAAVSITGFECPPVEIDKPTRLDPSILLAAIRNRRSIRQFKNQPVTDDLITQVIEAGRLTPSGKNAQDVSYIVLHEQIEKFETIAVRLFRKAMPLAKLVSPIARNTEIDPDFFFKKAPIAIMLIAKDKVNGALAASNMALMAEAFGLGVLYSGFFTMAANLSLSMRRQLGLKHGDKVITTLVLGYASVRYYRTAQKESAKVCIR